MSAFTPTQQPLATDRQLRYLHELVIRRANIPLGMPERVDPALRIFVPHAGMTMEQASKAIEFWKLIPTSWNRWQAAKNERSQKVRQWLHGDAEAVVANRWDTILDLHFFIDREVRGLHWSGARLRIDRILRPKGWTWDCGHSHAIGFEIKTDRAKWPDVVAQAADYANTTWAGVNEGGIVLVGVSVPDIELTRQLAPVGCFGFSIHPAWIEPHHHEPDLHLHWNGTRMWTGTTDPNRTAARRIAHTGWCPVRKFGSR